MPLKNTKGKNEAEESKQGVYIYRHMWNEHKLVGKELN